MQRAFCPYCKHCQMLTEMAEKAEKIKAEQELQAAAEQARQEEKDRIAIREGKIHLRNFHLYTKEEIKCITDIDFLHEMYDAITPAGQPPSEWEFEELCKMQNAILSRIKVLSE